MFFDELEGLLRPCLLRDGNVFRFVEDAKGQVHDVWRLRTAITLTELDGIEHREKSSNTFESFIQSGQVRERGDDTSADGPRLVAADQIREVANGSLTFRVTSPRVKYLLANNASCTYGAVRLGVSGGECECPRLNRHVRALGSSPSSGPSPSS